MRITKKQDRMPGIILTILLFVAEIAFTVLLLYTNLLSAKYIGIVFAVLLVSVSYYTSPSPRDVEESRMPSSA